MIREIDFSVALVERVNWMAEGGELRWGDDDSGFWLLHGFLRPKSRSTL